MFFFSTASGGRERDCQVEVGDDVRGAAVGGEDRLELRPVLQLPLDVREFSVSSHWAGIVRLFRSLSMPVARAERPKSVRNGLVMLPSAIAIAGISRGCT